MSSALIDFTFVYLSCKETKICLPSFHFLFCTFRQGLQRLNRSRCWEHCRVQAFLRSGQANDCALSRPTYARGCPGSPWSLGLQSSCHRCDKECSLIPRSTSDPYLCWTRSWSFAQCNLGGRWCKFHRSWCPRWCLQQPQSLKNRPSNTRKRLQVLGRCW